MNQREANKRAARIVEMLIGRWLDLHESLHEEELSPTDQARLDEALKRIQRQMGDRAGEMVGRGRAAAHRGDRKID